MFGIDVNGLICDFCDTATTIIGGQIGEPQTKQTVIQDVVGLCGKIPLIGGLVSLGGLTFDPPPSNSEMGKKSKISYSLSALGALP